MSKLNPIDKPNGLDKTQELLWYLWQTLTNILNQGGGGGNFPPAVARTAAKTTVLVDGSTAGGEQGVSFLTDDTFTGTIAGDTAGPGEVYSWNAKLNDTLNPISYTVNTGRLTITTLV